MFNGFKEIPSDNPPEIYLKNFSRNSLKKSSSDSSDICAISKKNSEKIPGGLSETIPGKNCEKITGNIVAKWQCWIVQIATFYVYRHIELNCVSKK